jgi:hypothetical protein
MRFYVLREERKNQLDFEINFGFFLLRVNFDFYVILYMSILFFSFKFKN